MWLLDSGAFATMTSNRKLIFDYSQNIMNLNVSVADGNELPILGSGWVTIDLPDGPRLTVKSLHVSGLSMNLLAINDVIDSGFKVLFDSSEAIIFGTDMQIPLSRIPRGPDNVFTLKCNSVIHCNAVRRSTITFRELHETLGHTRGFLLNQMIRNGYLDGLTVTGPFELDCVHCRMCKSVNPPHARTSSRQPQFAGDIISADVIDLRAHPSSEGHKFVSLIVDQFTYITSVLPLMQKDANSIRNHIEAFERSIANISNRPIRTLRTDQGTEYDNATLRTYTSSRGTTHEFANVGVPADNGFAERRIRTLVEHARAMINAAGLPTTYWSDAISYACYIQNRIPRHGRRFHSPYERLYGRAAALNQLAVFGQICYLRVNPSDKFEATSIPSLFLGYNLTTDGFIVQRLDNNQRTTSRNINFPPLMFIGDFPSVHGGWLTESESNIPDFSVTLDAPIEEPSLFDVPVVPNMLATTNSEPVMESEIDPRTLMKQKATKAISELFRSSGRACSAQVGYNKTLKGDLASLYEQARDKEWESLMNLQAFTIVDRPDDQRPIRSHFVHSIKTHADGSFSSVKARLVANGNEQEEGVNYTETYAPTPAPDLIRLLLIIAAH